MTEIKDEYSFHWENDEVKVDIPFSAAGIGTTIVLTSLFTGKTMLLDVGDGAVRDLLALFKSASWVGELDLIAISHGHFDHVGGLHTLLSFMRMLQRQASLNILIPKRSMECIGIIKGYRNLYRDSLPYRAWYHELVNNSEFDTDFFKVKATSVEHYSLESDPPEALIPALGYRVKVGTTTIAYTGDTRLCEGAEKLVDDADLAIIEATRTSPPKGEYRVHLTGEEAETLGKRAKEHILIHKIPEYPKWRPDL